MAEARKTTLKKTPVVIKHTPEREAAALINERIQQNTDRLIYRLSRIKRNTQGLLDTVTHVLTDHTETLRTCVQPALTAMQPDVQATAHNSNVIACRMTDLKAAQEDLRADVQTLGSAIAESNRLLRDILALMKSGLTTKIVEDKPAPRPAPAPVVVNVHNSHPSPSIRAQGAIDIQA